MVTSIRITQQSMGITSYLLQGMLEMTDVTMASILSSLTGSKRTHNAKTMVTRDWNHPHRLIVN